MIPQFLLEDILAYSRSRKFDYRKIEKAFKIAVKLHKGQKRKSGEPFIIHPLSVAHSLIEYGVDEKSIIAGLLHDAVEDTQYTPKEVRKNFGMEVEKLIDGLTKFHKTKFRKAETLDRKIESLRKWFEVMQDDVRVAVIKLADRLHNMKTLEVHQEGKRQRIAKETLDVFTKIAEKLGMTKMKNELSDLCLAHLDPKSYRQLKKIQKNEMEQEGKDTIKRYLKDADTQGIIVEIKSEVPTLFEMHKNEVQLKEEIKGVLPLMFSVITQSPENCYSVLYLIHNLWKPERKSIEDYIQLPLSNGYQALHTTVIFEEGRRGVFRIQTREMKNYSDRGVTCFCFAGAKNGQRLLSWLKQLPLVTRGEKQHSENFLQQLQHDILDEHVIIHTDKDENLLLPGNSTALDAAFHSHGKKALQLIKVFVNGETSSFYKPLKQNDTVHFYCLLAGAKPPTLVGWLQPDGL